MSKKAFTLSDHEFPTKPQPEANNTKRKDSTPVNKERHNVHVASPTSAPTTQKICYNDCKLCPGEKHFLYHCHQWHTFSIAQKIAHVGTHNLCTNCLHPHSTADCKSTTRCHECHQKHHTSLHQTMPSPTVTTLLSSPMQDGLMSTAQILLHGPNGKTLQARALIDSGAGISLVTKKVVQLLNLPLETINVQLTVAQGEVTKPLQHKTSLIITPLHDRTRKMSCQPAVSEAVAGIMPTQPLPSVTDLPYIAGLPLADSSYNMPGVIDIILGTDMFSKIFPNNCPTRTGAEDEPIAQPTVFGWTLSGTVPGITTSSNSATTYCQTPNASNLSPYQPMNRSQILNLSSTLEAEAQHNLLQHKLNEKQADRDSSSATLSNSMEEAIFPQPPSPEGQTPQQIPILAVALHLAPSDTSTECQTPQQIPLSAKSLPTHRLTPPKSAISTQPKKQSSNRPVQPAETTKSIGTLIIRALLVLLMISLHFRQQLDTSYPSIKSEEHRTSSHCNQLQFQLALLGPTAVLQAVLRPTTTFQIYPSNWSPRLQQPPNQSNSTKSSSYFIQPSARRLGRTTCSTTSADTTFHRSSTWTDVRQQQERCKEQHRLVHQPGKEQATSPPGNLFRQGAQEDQEPA